MEENLDYVQMSRDGIEVFLDIPGYIGLYQVSNLGRVKSLSRNTHHTIISKEKIIKSHITKKGYFIIGLSIDKKRKMFTVHQLVSMAFLNHKIDGYTLVINHIDFNRLNNFLYNLEIVTSRYNNSNTSKKTTSTYTGVCWSNRNSKWKTSIKIKGHTFNLGVFINETDAANRYNEALHNLENGTFEYYFLNLNLTCKKKVEKYNINGEFIREYKSIYEAAILNNCNPSAITSCCKGRYKTAGGYKWSYVE